AGRPAACGRRIDRVFPARDRPLSLATGQGRRIAMGFIPPVVASSTKPQVDVRLNVVSVMVFVIVAALGLALALPTRNPLYFIGGLLLAMLLALSPKVAKQWEKAIILRL